MIPVFFVCMFVMFVFSVIIYKGKYDVSTLVNSVLGGLVSITAGCAVIRPWEAVITGIIGGMFPVIGVRILNKLKVDDPVGAISVHGICGIWVCTLNSVRNIFERLGTLEFHVKKYYRFFDSTCCSD